MTEPVLHVLIVDDEPTYRLVLTQTLKGCGHVTEACESGDDAISLLQKNKYDVVLLDYKMPGTSGINHSLVEDPSLFLSLGLSPFWLWVPRLLAAILAERLLRLWRLFLKKKR